jgi:D-alanyl-D-alanine carboxypeptidase
MYKKIVVGIAVVAAIIIILPHKVRDKNALRPAVASSDIVNTPDSTIAAPEYLNQDPPTLSAKAALAIDVSTGTNLFAQKFDEKLPIASLTKLMTAMVALDHTNKDQVVTVQKSDIQVVGSNMGLIPG